MAEGGEGIKSLDMKALQMADLIVEPGETTNVIILGGKALEPLILLNANDTDESIMKGISIGANNSRPLIYNKK